MSDLHPNFRLWIYSDTRKGVFGDGKARLLREVGRTGSLRAASGNLRISYRKAWGDIRKAETCVGAKLAVRSRGGTAGGRTVLTPRCVALLEAYARFRAAAERDVGKLFVKHMVPCL